MTLKFVFVLSFLFTFSELFSVSKSSDSSLEFQNNQPFINPTSGDAEVNQDDETIPTVMEIPHNALDCSSEPWNSSLNCTEFALKDINEDRSLSDNVASIAAEPPRAAKIIHLKKIEIPPNGKFHHEGELMESNYLKKLLRERRSEKGYLDEYGSVMRRLFPEHFTTSTEYLSDDESYKSKSFNFPAGSSRRKSKHKNRNSLITKQKVKKPVNKQYDEESLHFRDAGEIITEIITFINHILVTAVDSSAETGTSISGGTEAGTPISGETGTGTSISGGTEAGTSLSGGTEAGTTVSGGTEAGTTVSGGTEIGTSVSGGTETGTSVSGGTEAGTSISGGTETGTILSGGTEAGTSIAGTGETIGGAAMAKKKLTEVTESGGAVPKKNYHFHYHYFGAVEPPKFPGNDENTETTAV